MKILIKDYFDLLNNKKTSKLSLNDNFMMKVMGDDKEKIKIVDGVVNTLENVSYISKMWKNLFFFSLLKFPRL